jgi:mannose/cellobiose epimerase-like protein (N-acyl-D-glucosamine 2-epimerase family)
MIRQPMDLHSEALKLCAIEAKSWLFNEAAPLWVKASSGLPEAFAEELSAAGKASDVPLRLRVQARQIFAFTTLGRLGWTGPWRERVLGATELLINRGRREDGFFVHSFAANGAHLDSRADLYDHAFILFGLAHVAESTERKDVLAVANEILDLINKHWRHPLGGFYEGEIDGPPRRQNPHMHMLEASLALFRVSGDLRWKTLADEIIQLCLTHFVRSGAITEYFEDDWSPLSGEQGTIVEPGHCFEWAWLLEKTGLPAARVVSDNIVGFARAHGIDTVNNLAFNEIRIDTSLRDGGTRVWPHTERLKIALARLRRLGTSEEIQEAIAAFRGLQRHFDTDVRGLWHERWRPDSGWVVQPVPASSFYHIVCALGELIQATATHAGKETPNGEAQGI